MKTFQQGIGFYCSSCKSGYRDMCFIAQMARRKGPRPREGPGGKHSKLVRRRHWQPRYPVEVYMRIGALPEESFPTPVETPAPTQQTDRK
eukprot:1017358-Amphidinium_carterae.1